MGGPSAVSREDVWVRLGGDSDGCGSSAVESVLSTGVRPGGNPVIEGRLSFSLVTSFRPFLFF